MVLSRLCIPMLIRQTEDLQCNIDAQLQVDTHLTCGPHSPHHCVHSHERWWSILLASGLVSFQRSPSPRQHPGASLCMHVSSAFSSEERINTASVNSDSIVLQCNEYARLGNRPSDGG